jgi:hypothetical protein
MIGQKSLISIILALVFAAFSWGIGQAADEQVKQPPQTTIVDAAGRTHTVMPMRNITQEQRRAAAARRKGQAAHAGHHKKSTVPTANGEVTK